MQLAKCTLSFALMMASILCSPVQAESEHTHESLYQQAGLDRQFEGLWREVRSEYAGLPKREESHDSEQTVLDLIESKFSEKQLRVSILDYWKQHLSLSDVKFVSQWLESPLGLELTLAEVNASVGQGDTAMPTYLNRLREAPPSKTRIDLLRLLDKAVRASDASTEMGMNVHLAAVTAQHASGQAPDNAATTEQQAKSLESDRGLIKAMIRQDVLRYNLFAYRNIDDESLRRYITFANSPSGENYHKSTFFAIKAAMLTASEELQRQLRGLPLQANSNF